MKPESSTSAGAAVPTQEARLRERTGSALDLEEPGGGTGPEGVGGLGLVGHGPDLGPLDDGGHRPLDHLAFRAAQEGDPERYDKAIERFRAIDKEVWAEMEEFERSWLAAG